MSAHRSAQAAAKATSTAAQSTAVLASRAAARRSTLRPDTHGATYNNSSGGGGGGGAIGGSRSDSAGGASGVRRKRLYIIAGALLYLSTAYVGYNWYKLSRLEPLPADAYRYSRDRSPASHASLAASASTAERAGAGADAGAGAGAVPDAVAAADDLADLYDDNAGCYDESVKWDEYLGGISALRAELAGLCKGDVLEVAAGTGRNLPFYDLRPSNRTVQSSSGGDGDGDGDGERRVTSLTLVDRSAPMLEVAERLWTSLSAKSTSASTSSPTPAAVDVRFIAQDLSGLSPNRQRYDAVVQTFGLCSVSDPVSHMRQLVSFCEPADGEILLLEHGRSTYGWLNWILDRAAVGHAKTWGCYFNRDIDVIIERHCADLVDVVEKRRRHLGTTYIYRLRPKRAVE